MSDRPPLGIPPYEITAYLRIKDIVKAMDRYIEADLMNNNLFLNWAKEIICQIELLEKMNEKDEEKTDDND